MIQSTVRGEGRMGLFCCFVNHENHLDPNPNPNQVVTPRLANATEAAKASPTQPNCTPTDTRIT